MYNYWEDLIETINKCCDDNRYWNVLRDKSNVNLAFELFTKKFNLRFDLLKNFRLDGFEIWSISNVGELKSEPEVLTHYVKTDENKRMFIFLDNSFNPLIKYNSLLDKVDGFFIFVNNDNVFDVTSMKKIGEKNRKDIDKYITFKSEISTLRKNCNLERDNLLWVKTDLYLDLEDMESTREEFNKKMSDLIKTVKNNN